MGFVRRALPVASLVWALACARAHGPGHVDAAAAPDPRACSVDADCTFGFGIDDSGCCLAENVPAAGAHNVAYERWAQARIASAQCKRASCPPMASPIQPPPGSCMATPACRGGRCADACGR